MDDIDRKIAELIQGDGQLSSAEVGKAVGVSTSTANERIRKLTATGVVKAWRAILDPNRVGARLCALIFVDIDYGGEEAFRRAVAQMPEVQEAHHVTGAHSYLLKVRVADTEALQAFLENKIKPLGGITRTESLVVLRTLKETSQVLLIRKDEEA
ncbi:MAG: Lrp/AsnC family transcriptional regulator [Kiloniellales bacterium]|nr:Lrp/AsnC family transcriptional regulator [Kiloniellales bacterium]